jgi:regulator of protease activity HflC (stomatin/prohibitin superfamily)
MNRSKNKKAQAEFALILFGVILVVGFIALMLGFDTVEANHRAVKVSFGQITGEMNPGTQWTGLFTSVVPYDMRIRQLTVTMQGDQAAVDKDGQSVFATIDINYRLNPASIQDAYSKVGTDQDLARMLNIEGIIKEGFKTTTSKYTSTEIWQNRELVKQEAIKKISENFPKEYFTLENVVVTNLDYNAAFKAAIEQQKVNEKLALSKEAEVKIAQFEADKTIQNARGAAESKKLAAEADAYTTLANAKAEAEALGLKRTQLTPMMIQNNMIDKWDGKYPQYLIVTPGSNFLMQLPSQGSSGASQ